MSNESIGDHINLRTLQEEEAILTDSIGKLTNHRDKVRKAIQFLKDKYGIEDVK